MSLVGFRAKNHPQQPTQDWVDDRRTPRDLFDRLHSQFDFTLDAAASSANALLPHYFTTETNALVQSWAGHRVWCNPPYSGLKAWVEKASCEVRDACPLVVMLLPSNRTEQSWWQVYIEPFRDRRRGLGRRVAVTTQFLPGRMRFAWPPERVVPPKGDRPPFGVVLVIFSWTGAFDWPGL